MRCFFGRCVEVRAPRASLEGGVDRRELVFDVGAKSVDDRNDREGDARRDQSIFDGGGAVLIIEKFVYFFHERNCAEESLRFPEPAREQSIKADCPLSNTGTLVLCRWA